MSLKWKKRLVKLELSLALVFVAVMFLIPLPAILRSLIGLPGFLLAIHSYKASLDVFELEIRDDYKEVLRD
jgi:hypothetical protein